MLNNLDINKYLKSINSSAAINAVSDKSISNNQETAAPSVNMQFNNSSNLQGSTKFWVT